ncbi:ribosome small subunit-dependent GTPase [Halobacteriovorax marinus]|uniref:Small ribosomal subunit biogenesis GTPase RsgA n=1 Tax=Halobacteriovorax marinus (strain ATCC BAA-682 / DSM 15412 / SJ) TaxID=862908 RepID=E1X587_HALMS|nr:ribosome small subunit-dependent GTPase A [Halobacteriovorax marinus]ATH06986.1 ribosome small subunit-dependent GTPase [Halobacteriovorax marinus]CBW25559.1 Probable GTPase engC [Halobacteriovorax marinus SJ]
MRARIYKSDKRQFECKLEESGEVVKANALGNLLKKGETLVVGDWVQLEKIEETDEFQITSLEERESEIFRIIVREQRKKVTAANCDLLIILTSVSKPKYKRGFIDRFLARASQWGIRPIVVFNKMDEFKEEFDIKFEEERLKSLGAKCFEISALQPDYQPRYLERGYSELKEEISNRTSIFLGQSGVGKSATINTLSEGKYQLKTNTIARVGKGSHTTTWSEIIDLDGFCTIDSPGIRSFSLEDVDPEELLSLFPDLEEIASHCKFSNCEHLENSKGCVFWSKYTPDSPEGELVHSRLDSFQRIYEEVSALEFWQKKY